VSDRDDLLALAVARDWRTVHDLGLHVEFERWHGGRRCLAMQFDQDGRLLWASQCWPHLPPLTYARIILATNADSSLMQVQPNPARLP
jgi:hypothetical protein